MKPFVTTRTFNAPVDLMFKLWSEPAHMDKWLTPKGTKSHYVTADIRVGHGVHYYMQMPDGSKMWGKTEYKEITPPTKLVYNQWFSDEKGGVGAHPMSPTWPKMMQTTVRLEKDPAGTKLTLEWLPVDASAEELATFDSARAGMTQGWAGSFENLDEYLASIR